MSIGSYKEKKWKSHAKSRTSACALNYRDYIGGSKSQKYKEFKKLSIFIILKQKIPVETAEFIAKTQSHMICEVKFSQFHKPNLRCNRYLITECNLIYCTVRTFRKQWVSDVHTKMFLMTTIQKSKKTVWCWKVIPFNHVWLILKARSSLLLEVNVE